MRALMGELFKNFILIPSGFENLATDSAIILNNYATHKDENRMKSDILDNIAPLVVAVIQTPKD